DRLFGLLASEKDRRNQISNRLSNSSSRFNHQVPLFLQRPRDCCCHFLLLGSVFEIPRLREQSIFGKNAPNPLNEITLQGILQRNHRQLLTSVSERYGS